MENMTDVQILRNDSRRTKARQNYRANLIGQLRETVTRLGNAQRAFEKGDAVAGSPGKLAALEKDRQRLAKEISEYVV